MRFNHSTGNLRHLLPKEACVPHPCTASPSPSPLPPSFKRHSYLQTQDFTRGPVLSYEILKTQTARPSGALDRILVISVQINQPVNPSGVGKSALSIGRSWQAVVSAISWRWRFEHVDGHTMSCGGEMMNKQVFCPSQIDLAGTSHCATRARIDQITSTTSSRIRDTF